MQGARTRRAVLILLSVSLFIILLLSIVVVVFPARNRGGSTPQVQPVEAKKFGSTILGSTGWQVRTGEKNTEEAAHLASPEHGNDNWMIVQPDDAGAAGTVINALLQNGECPNVFYSQNMRDCFGYVTTPGPVETPRFAVPWWFRTDFDLGTGLAPDQQAHVVIPGVMGEADVWLNGQEIAQRDTISGAYARHELDVTAVLHPGKNTLAFMIYPNDPAGMFTTSSADWSQIPPDNNTGLQYPISLDVSGSLGLTNTHINQNNSADLSRSTLTVVTRIRKNTDTPVHGELTAIISPPKDGPPVELHASVDLAAEQKTADVTFEPTTLTNPEIWWPYSMGEQPLYSLDVTITEEKVPTDSSHSQFGIRNVGSRLVGETPEAPGGWRQFSINGKDILIRGGESAPDLFLRYRKDETARQILLIKNMGLNAIRLEGHDQPSDYYEQMDRAGILIIGGFMCCNSWQPINDDILTERDEKIIYESSRGIGEHERHHPSVFTYGWSDNEPTPKQERATLRGFHEADFDVPIIASAMYKNTPSLEWSGQREGPYDWVPPYYWYEAGHLGPNNFTLTNISGSRGFGNEQGAGDSIPTVQSLKKFLSPEELEKLWRDPNYNQYHTNFQPAVNGQNLHGPATGDGYAFGTLYNFSTALAQRYGPPTALESFVALSQVANYESVRAQFEAFIRYSTDKKSPSTGIVYFMINQGWPSLLWNLFGSDGDQPGSYFGAVAANRPLHGLLSYDDNTVTVANFSPQQRDNLTVTAHVASITGDILDTQSTKIGSLDSQEVKNTDLKPRIPLVGPCYFVEILLKQGDTVVDRNVYWRSTRPDIVDWDANAGNRINFPNAPMKQYADFTALRSIPTAVTSVTVSEPEPGKVAVHIVNTSNQVAFFLRADAPESGFTLWDNNDITLLPGESETITGSYTPPADSHTPPKITFSGFNVDPITIG